MTTAQLGSGLARLPWDSEFFGHGIARLTAQGLTREQCQAVRRQCAAEAIECVYFLADPADGQSIYTCEAEGFHLVDVRLTLARHTETAFPAPSANRSVRIRAAQAADLQALKQIAGFSHLDTRFYYDRNFTREQCTALYETWIEKSLVGYADQVWVAEHEGRAAGYLTATMGAGQAGSLGLMAVHPDQRGQGVGQALLQAGLAWLETQGTTTISVVTQARNVGAQRLYQRHGFVTQAIGVWYHWWIAPKYHPD